MNMLKETRKTSCCHRSYRDSSFRHTCESDLYVDVYEHVEGKKTKTFSLCKEFIKRSDNDLRNKVFTDM